jgi:hypothetical protein
MSFYIEEEILKSLRLYVAKEKNKGKNISMSSVIHKCLEDLLRVPKENRKIRVSNPIMTSREYTNKLRHFPELSKYVDVKLDGKKKYYIVKDVYMDRFIFSKGE